MRIRIKRIFSDGSSRHFFKVNLGAVSLILMYNPIHKDGVNENDSYYYIGMHLYNKGVSVPRIYFYDRDRDIFWIEDVGGSHLQEIVDFQKDPERSIRLYEKVLEQMERLCIEGAYGFDSRYCYDTPVYDSGFILERELNYFSREFLISYLKIRPPRALEREFIKLSESISNIPNNFLIHRDFQSRNIMVHSKGVYLIDFQGARFGPPTYDLASLIIDPYVDIPRYYRSYLIREYFLDIKKYLDYSWDDFFLLFWKTALCRNLQILGAFSFLSIKKEKSFFKRFIPYALRNLRIIFQYLENEFPILESVIFG